jgi:hypothetical protein
VQVMRERATYHRVLDMQFLLKLQRDEAMF